MRKLEWVVGAPLRRGGLRESMPGDVAVDRPGDPEIAANPLAMLVLPQKPCPRYDKKSRHQLLRLCDADVISDSAAMVNSALFPENQV